VRRQAGLILVEVAAEPIADSTGTNVFVSI
jgi:hypothetical protein